MAEVIIDGRRYYPLSDAERGKWAGMPDAPVEVSGIIEAARRSISHTNWRVGYLAFNWAQFARGRTQIDFAASVGLSPEQVRKRSLVWEKFGSVYSNYPCLLWDHFHAALEWEDAAECLKWAQDVQANVAEMRAWRRAQHGELPE